jgi:hypothetical protein
LAQFRYLVGKYGNQHPDLRELGQLPDEEAVTLNQIIETAQDLFDSTGVFVDANEIGRTLTRRFVEHLRPAISLHAERSGFSCDDAIEWLVGDGFGRLPSVRVIPLLVRAYLARHKGVPGKARKPRENDLMDMQHLRALPYVNHLVTDGFWADAARSVAVEWGTKVYRTSKELAVALQAQFG